MSGLKVTIVYVKIYSKHTIIYRAELLTILNPDTPADFADS